MNALSGLVNEAETAQPRASDSQAFHALGSEARLGLLRVLAVGERTLDQLRRATGLREAAVRYHLGILLQDDLVERVPARPDGRVGRPTNRYRLRATPGVSGFPPRQYETLSEVLLGVVCSSLDRRGWERALYQAGRGSGHQMIDSIRQTAGVDRWTPERFVQHFLSDAMRSMGVQTEVVESHRDRVRYRTLTCPFQELAARYPDRICDHLDAGFHDGVADGLGPRVVNRRSSCMGHGDPFCEYTVQWKRRASKEEGR